MKRFGLFLAAAGLAGALVFGAACSEKSWLKKHLESCPCQKDKEGDAPTCSEAEKSTCPHAEKAAGTQAEKSACPHAEKAACAQTEEGQCPHAEKTTCSDAEKGGCPHAEKGSCPKTGEDPAGAGCADCRAEGKECPEHKAAESAPPATE